MKLALRKDAATDANWAERTFAALTRWRLTSQWCHGGVVIGDRLYHSNAREGLHCSDYTPERWDLIELGPQLDAHALSQFDRLQGAKYDFLGVMGFVFPGLRGSADRFYCFEWCAVAMDMPPTEWITPELLLNHVVAREALI